jgi:hypothetical protein
LKQSLSIGVLGGSIIGGLRSQFWPVIKRVSRYKTYLVLASS